MRRGDACSRVHRSSIPGQTVWKKCEASRVAVLNDAAAYFGALRDALLLAERQVHIIGWDIHSETPLVGPSGRVDDGLPVALGPFLTGLLEAKPDLRINILIWDFAALYAVEREWNSADKFMAAGNGRIRFCLDSSLPLGSSQHQKIVVIDNAVAFSGGLDLTIRRWDTSEHLADHPLRRDPEGKPYPPFHDVQCMVEGEAAAALGEIAAARWAAAGCTMEACETVEGDRWPASVPAGATADPGRHRADRIANRVARRGSTRWPGCSRPRSMRQAASSISKTSSPAPPRSPRCWRGGWPTCRRCACSS